MSLTNLFIKWSNVFAILLAIGCVVLLIFLGYFLYRKITQSKQTAEEPAVGYRRNNNQILTIVESAILVALAMVLELIFKAIPFLDMPQGGSASLAMLPLFILAYRRGVSWGVLGGVVYGAINIMLDGGIAHWASIFLDYILAFGCIGLAGIFRKQAMKNPIWLCIGCFIGVFGRYLLTGLSGVVLFGEYAPVGMNVWYYSYIFYNLPYMAVSMIMCMVVLVCVRRIVFLNIETA